MHCSKCLSRSAFSALRSTALFGVNGHRGAQPADARVVLRGPIGRWPAQVVGAEGFEPPTYSV